MENLFIDVRLDDRAAGDEAVAQRLEEVCPVGIFARDEHRHAIVIRENLDECVLCDLCIDAAPDGAVEIVKLYEN